MALRSDEITALLNARVGERLDGEGEADGLNSPSDVAYALFLEPPTQPDPRWGPGEQCIDFAVKTFQPYPALAHCELLLPPLPLSEADRTQFATYLGRCSAWQLDRQDGYSFYLLEHGSRWRAVPVLAENAASRIREEADLELGVEYSLARYLTSTRALRWISKWVGETRRAPGHCANLVSRVLKNGLAGSGIPKNNSNFYGPSSLYTELCATARSCALKMGATQVAEVPEETAAVVHQLLRAPMTAEVVQKTGDQACMEAVRALTMRSLSALAGGDETAQRLTQQQLATALLRWVLLREQGGSPVYS